MDYDDKLVRRLLDEENYVEAESVIREFLSKYPDSHWLLACLSTCLHEQRRYVEAIAAGYQACQIAPNCPLSLWYYATALDSYGRSHDHAGSLENAINVYKGMLSFGYKYLANVEPCGEGVRWSRAVLNDCRYRLGLIYWHKEDAKSAKRWMKLHLRMRQPGNKSLYDKRDVVKELKAVESGVTYVEHFRHA